jgi:hypothetical protein
VPAHELLERRAIAALRAEHELGVGVAHRAQREEREARRTQHSFAVSSRRQLR